MRIIALAALATSLAACVVAEPPAPSVDATELPFTPDPAEALALLLETEDVGEAASGFTAEEWCAVKCSAVTYVGCATVAGVCLTTDVITLGAVSIPCAWALAAACGAGAAGVAACIRACT